MPLAALPKKKKTPSPEPEPEKVPEPKKPSQEPPVFVEVYEDKTYEEKSTVTLRAKVTGKPEPDTKWYFQNRIMAGTLKVKITKEKDGIHILTITGVTEKQAGVYKCVATNKAGKAEHSATINVTGRVSRDDINPLIQYNAYQTPFIQYYIYQPSIRITHLFTLLSLL